MRQGISNTRCFEIPLHTCNLMVTIKKKTTTNAREDVSKPSFQCKPVQPINTSEQVLLTKLE